MRAVVTGGAGFIGSTLVDALVKRGDEVHVVDDLSSGRREQVNEAATLHVRDIVEPLVDVFAEARPEVVFHLAAQIDVRASVADPVADGRSNVLGTISRARGGPPHDAQVVFASTGGAIYGECAAPATEDAARLPLSPYGTSKLAAEEYLATWNRLYGTRHVALRLGNVYGPRQDPHGEAGVVAIFLSRIRDGRRRRSTATAADPRLRLRRRRRAGVRRRRRRRGRRVQRRHGRGDLRRRTVAGVPRRGRCRGGGNPWPGTPRRAGSEAASIPTARRRRSSGALRCRSPGPPRDVGVDPEGMTSARANGFASWTTRFASTVWSSPFARGGRQPS